MSDYIDREKFIKLLVNRDLREISTKTIGECLDKAEVADVVEVRHGHWIRESVGSDNSSEGYFKISMAKCSECGTCVMGKPNYCPNCGAKMDGEEQEHE